MSTRCVTIKNGCLRLYFLETALASEMASAMTVRFVTFPVRLNPDSLLLLRNCGATLVFDY